ncbi:MAG TPA: hypothetical protein VFT95_14830 [Micromonosporaceae bacterium]|nr:hypothetical protein [Micromonosporaceae bacterium]
MRRVGRMRRDDSGAALLLALVVVTVVAIGAAVLLTFVDTNIRTTVQLREQAADIYNADAAMDAAIDELRTNGADPALGDDCFGSDGDRFRLPTGFYGADTAVVECALDPDLDEREVMIACDPLGDCNRPGSAILTLGRVAGEDGLNIQQPTGSSLRVHGGVFSNSNINVVNGRLDTDTWVTARGACAGSITSVPAANCNIGTVTNRYGEDPLYAKDASTVPTHRSLPACTTQRSVVTFQPGYYDDAVGLSAMMDGNSQCRKSTWWFTPGVYYFDFRNSGTNRNPLLPSGTNVWEMEDADGAIVAGTPVDADGNELAAPPVRSTAPGGSIVPGACDSPINNSTAKGGVQFIFGGDSRFVIKKGEAEICGTYSRTKPPVAVYGLTSGDDTPVALTGADRLKLTSVTAQGGFGTTATATRLANVDGTPAASWTANANNQKTKVSVRGFAPPAQIPAGSILTGATVRVTHRHGVTTNKDALTVTLTPNGGAASVTGTSVGQNGGAAFATDTVALDASATGALADSVYKGTFTGATVDVEVTLPTRNDTEEIDAIQLDLTYLPPAFRGARGCVTVTPYTGGGADAPACSLITSQNFSGNELYVQGTTYVPKGAVDIILNNAAEQVFRFGVISRSLWAKLTGSFSYTGVVIEVPDDSPGFGFGIYLNAYVCPDTAQADCDPDSSPDLRAKVAFVDISPTERDVMVLSWSRPAG